MDRSYTARDLIQLPRLSARETVVLVTEIETAAQQAKSDLSLKKLPLSIERAFGRMLKERGALDALLIPQPKEGDTQAKRKADRAVDNAWAALHAWLAGWCLLPPEKNVHLDAAFALRDLVFGKGLEFTQLPYKIEWHESKTRLEAIARDGHDKTIAKLGGKPFLDYLHETQTAYGEALGVTKVVPESSEADLRAAQLRALDAVRLFVSRASAHGDPEDPGSEELAASLLAPIVTWESRSAATSIEAAAPVPAQAPAAPSADPAVG